MEYPMPALTGPLFSLTARKSLRKTLTYSRWRGIQYVRSHVVPANPNTTAQQDQRNNFANINTVWNYAGTRFREPWTARATGQPFTDRNLFIKQNVEALYGQADMTDFVFSPGSGGAPPPTLGAVTPGSGQLSIAVTAPGIPTGWSIVEAVGAAFPDADPTVRQSSFDVNEGFDATSAYAVVITGLPASLCVVGIWLKWLRPDGLFAYSVSVNTTGTPS